MRRPQIQSLRIAGDRRRRFAGPIIALVFFIPVALACISMFRYPGHVDFLSYWAAGRLVLQGHPAAAYDLAAHREVEMTAGVRLGLIPFPYPPAFLFAITPFALLPLASSFTLWLLTTIVAYILCVRRFVPPTEAFAHPSVVTNGLIGQNGFLTSAIFAGGLALLASSPVAAGAVLGLLSYKPQFAILIPIALAAGREWKALASAAVSSCALWLCALAAFGPVTYAGFIQILPRYVQFVSASKWPWGQLASSFAFVRFLGGSEATALAVQGFVACLTVALVCRLWWYKMDGRLAALATGAILVPPYLFTYDALLLALAFGWLADRGRYVETLIAWILCVMPVLASFSLYSGPNTVPLAAILCLVTITRMSSPSGNPECVSKEDPPAPATMRPFTKLRPKAVSEGDPERL